MYSKELEELIENVLADGVITEQERNVLRKRAQACGEDPDEVIVDVEGRLAKAKKTSDTSKTSSNKKTEKSLSLDGYQAKELKDLSINRTSINADDFIEVLNTVSLELGGVTNLGVFCDIQNVEQTSALLSDIEEQFIHVELERGEQPYHTLVNDGSSTEPYDFSFNHLLNK